MSAAFVATLTLLTSPLAGPAIGCGPFFDVAKFSFGTHPDFPLTQFASGHLGILKPTFARSYLTVAYSYMTGNALDPVAQREIVQLWSARMVNGLYSPSNDTSASDTTNAKAETAEEQWETIVRHDMPELSHIRIPKDTSQRARSAVWTMVEKRYNLNSGRYNGERWETAYHVADSLTELRLPDSIKAQEKQLQRYDRINWQKDIYDDAFSNAIDTYRSLQKRFGKRSHEAMDWLYTEDTVFTTDALPSLAALTESQTIVQNRQYQRAAAAFYDKQYAVAYGLFHDIAGDPHSRWHSIAPYLAARTLVRESWDADTITAPQLQKQAIDELHAILKDRSHSAYADAASRLLNAVRSAYEPEVRLHEVARSLNAKPGGVAYVMLVADFTSLLDRFYDLSDYDVQVHRKALPKLREDDITDWVSIFQASDSAAHDYAIKQWQKKQTLPWLVAALSKLRPTDRAANEIVAQAQQIPDTSYAYVTARYYLASFAEAKGARNDARSTIDALLSDRTSLSKADRNDFEDLRMHAATSFEDFVAHLEMHPTAVTSDDNDELGITQTQESDLDSESLAFQKEELHSYLTPIGESAEHVFNEFTPNQLLLQASESASLSAQLRARLAIAAWSRAVLSDEDSIAVVSAQTLVGAAPEYRKLFAPYFAVSSKTDRTYEALNIMLHAPIFSPWLRSGFSRFTPAFELDHFRNNWWCDDATTREHDSLERVWSRYYGGMQTTPPPITAPAFLTVAEIGRWRQERASIARLGSGPDFLARRAVEWAKARPNDPRIPEALHRAVKATRYACSTEETGKYSKAAFQLLHSRYPRSSWAKITKFWFD